MPSRSPRLIALAVLAIAVVVTATLLVTLHHGKRAGQIPAGASAVKITAADGTSLSALVFSPTGGGKHPLLVMPAGYKAAARTYAIVATGFAERGYVVLAYAQRGMADSTGKIDLAGPSTRSDVSTVIDWALQHTAADPVRIGLVGASYGAGISLLAAEHDARVKAVVALSPWANLASVLAPGGTPNVVSYEFLFHNTLNDGKATPDATKLYDDLTALNAPAAVADIDAMSPVRSPDSDPAALSNTAVLLSSSYQDSLLPPSKLIAFYNSLTGPKRLELAPGDHGAPALPGLFGKPGGVWADAVAWLGYYLQGSGTKPDPAASVQLQDAAGATQNFSSWASAGNPTTLYLGPSGTLTSAASDGWTTTITAGVATAATCGPQQFATGLSYAAPTTTIASINRVAAAVWAGQPTASELAVRGNASVQLTVSQSAPTTTLFGYLYDVAGDGMATLMSCGALTPADAATGQARTVDLTLQPMDWTVTAGHHLTLAIGTVDANRYLGQGGHGTVSFSSPSGDSSALRILAG